MGFFSRFLNKRSFPIKNLEETYQNFFKRYSPEIFDFMETKGYTYRDDTGIHIELSNLHYATHILTEYALFLKACAIYCVKKNMNNCPETELRSAFPLANDLVSKASAVDSYRSAVSNRIDDYLNSIYDNVVCGYSTQNHFGSQNYALVENACHIDTMRLALMFADCYYYIVINKDYATTKDIKTVKELAKNDTYQESNYYFKIAERLQKHAEILSEEIVKILINR